MRVTRSAEASFAAHSFPSTTEEFLADHGDVELELPNGAVTVAEVLAHMPNEEFHTEEDARLAIYNALGEDAIGRKGYSDRDPVAMGENGPEPLSF